MALSFPRLPRWLCGGNIKEKEKKESIPKGSKSKTGSSSSVKKTKRGGGGWMRRGGGSGEEMKMGNVMFPEPDDPEWSIGWVEPHGPGFKTEDDEDDCEGFVVLVPCYKKVMNGTGNQIPKGFFSPALDGKNMEQWLSPMRKL